MLPVKNILMAVLKISAIKQKMKFSGEESRSLPPRRCIQCESETNPSCQFYDVVSPCTNLTHRYCAVVSVSRYNDGESSTRVNRSLKLDLLTHDRDIIFGDTEKRFRLNAFICTRHHRVILLSFAKWHRLWLKLLCSSYDWWRCCCIRSRTTSWCQKKALAEEKSEVSSLI